MTACTCHNDFSTTHESCCGHDDGRDPDCPYHGDGSGPGAIHSPIRRDVNCQTGEGINMNGLDGLKD